MSLTESTCSVRLRAQEDLLIMVCPVLQGFGGWHVLIFSVALAQPEVVFMGWRTRKQQPGGWRQLMNFGDSLSPLTVFLPPRPPT